MKEEDMEALSPLYVLITSSFYLKTDTYSFKVLHPLLKAMTILLTPIMIKSMFLLLIILKKIRKRLIMLATVLLKLKKPELILKRKSVNLYPCRKFLLKFFPLHAEACRCKTRTWSARNRCHAAKFVVWAFGFHLWGLTFSWVHYFSYYDFFKILIYVISTIGSYARSFHITLIPTQIHLALVLR